MFCSVQSYTTIAHNNITGVLKDGIRFCGGSLNTFSENNIVGSASSGIALDGYSDAVLRNNLMDNGRGIGLGASYSVVFGNSITGNLESGLYYGASHCIISANQIADNKWGVFFTSFFANPNNDKFYHNNFVGNSHDVYIGSPYIVESWDNGYPSGGNYWSSYTGTDAKTGSEQNAPGSDGISDSPFTVSANNTDEYPLMAPFDISAAGSPPSAASPSTIVPHSAVALWHCDEVTPCGVTPDATGSNPAMLEPSSGNDDYHPVLVDGKFGKALRYSGGDYTYVAASPSLEIRGDFTVDVWVNVQEFKNVTYNNIVVECARSFGYPTRVWGLAVNGVQDNSSLPVGALRGYILDTTGRFNEIATMAPVISLNQWTHVVFTRSLATGMHLYVNDVEQEVTVTSGIQNPTDPISRGNEFYMGHDSFSTIDEVVISNVALTPGTQVPWLQWWFWTLIFGGFAALAGTAYFLRKNTSKRNTYKSGFSLEQHNMSQCSRGSRIPFYATDA